jgi:hypothetical protein
VNNLKDAGINTVRIPVSMLDVLSPGLTLIVILARILDRRALGQPRHGALPSWGNKVSGLFSPAHVVQL